MPRPVAPREAPPSPRPPARRGLGRGRLRTGRGFQSARLRLETAESPGLLGLVRLKRLAALGRRGDESRSHGKAWRLNNVSLALSGSSPEDRALVAVSPDGGKQDLKGRGRDLGPCSPDCAFLVISFNLLNHPAFVVVHWRKKWQPTPVFLPGESQGRGSLVGCRLWGRKESDMTEAT